MRRSAALFLAVGLMVSLAACSGSATDAAGCTPTKSGKVSDAVKVSGELGAKPTVDIAAPVTSKVTERTVAIKGDGDVAVKGSEVTLQVSLYSGTTGEAIQESAYDDSSEQTVPLTADLLPGFSKTLTCSTAGSRVVGVITAKDGYPAEQLASAGLPEDETIVIVADIVSTQKAAKVVAPLPKADGAEQALPEGFPGITVAVAEDETGTPTVTVPDGDAPAELQIAVLKKGDGKVIEENSDVVVNYQGQVWATKTIFDQSWGKGPATFNTGQVVPGFKKALEGQTVGSQVLVTMPPADGYGEAGQPDAGIGGTDTLVFIIDILGIA